MESIRSLASFDYDKLLIECYPLAVKVCFFEVFI